MRILLFLITFVLVFCAVTSAQEAETGPARVIGTVNRIDFTGNTALTDEQLQEAVPVKPGELLTAGDLQRISQAVTQAYRERGYLAVVGENILEGFEQTGVLTVPIVEAKVTKVRIEGLRKTRESTLRRFLELRPGDLYSVPALRRDARRLIALGVFEQVDANLEAA
ncbi:MAG TPA: POTRA domain-containing protein, partial [Armatimonadota bacterium]|nr:POTRA domain-containing protein [Armatimonadota bacterium]